MSRPALAAFLVLETDRLEPEPLEYNTDGHLTNESKIGVPARSADPIQQLQAQVEALTDLVLGGTA